LIFKKLGLKYSLTRKIRKGNPIEEIITEALESATELVALGGGGKQLELLHPKLGSTAGSLARRLSTHFLIARNVPTKITKILFCTGTELQVGKTMILGGDWVSNTDALIGLLHVQQVFSSEGNDQTQEAISESGSTPDDRNKIDLVLAQACQQLKSAGLNSEIVSSVRKGFIVEEVIKEVIENGYELLVIGAHYQPGQDRWQGTLFDDITDQLINRCPCSVLII
jgi:nucleotide-binding universal stress UspA family protein